MAARPIGFLEKSRTPNYRVTVTRGARYFVADVWAYGPECAKFRALEQYPGYTVSSVETI